MSQKQRVHLSAFRLICFASDELEFTSTSHPTPAPGSSSNPWPKPPRLVLEQGKQTHVGSFTGWTRTTINSVLTGPNMFNDSLSGRKQMNDARSGVQTNE